MDEYITKDQWLAGADVPINDFSGIPADADLRELAFVGFQEIGEICPEAWTE